MENGAGKMENGARKMENRAGKMENGAGKMENGAGKTGSAGKLNVQILRHRDLLWEFQYFDMGRS